MSDETEAMRPAGHALAAAEAIRALNHATIWRDSTGNYEYPGEVDETVAALETLAQRLPQALNQAAAWLRRAHQARQVGHDAGHDPADTVNTAGVLLQFAAARAETLADDLHGARQETAHLNACPTTDATAISATGGDGDEL